VGTLDGDFHCELRDAREVVGAAWISFERSILIYQTTEGIGMNSKAFRDFLLQEGLRQDALVHSTASQLGTKVGLFMVFAAFIFTAESTLAGLGTNAGLHIPSWSLDVSLVLALSGIGVLLWSARLKNYRMPPVLSVLRNESERFFQLVDIKGLPEVEQMERFNEKFINSLTRSIDENFSANRRIAHALEIAVILIGLSLACLLCSLLWPVLRAFCVSLSR
jgi:hypothetical protein